MTVESPVGFFNESSFDHPAAILRRAFASALGNEGVCGTADLAVTANPTPNMTVRVATGEAWVAGDDDANQGWYYTRVSATETVTIPTAHVTYDRIDLIVIRVYDSEYGSASAGADTAACEVVQGTPAASPVAPAVPDSALVLAQVTVQNGATAINSGDIADYRPFARPLPPRVWFDTNYASGVAIPGGSIYEYGRITFRTLAATRVKLSGWICATVLANGSLTANFEIRKDGASYAVPVLNYEGMPTVGASSGGDSIIHTVPVEWVADLDAAATWEIRLAGKNAGTGNTVLVWGSAFSIIEGAEPTDWEVV